MENMNNILKIKDSCLEGAPDCVLSERKLPLVRGVQVGTRPHQLYSPGPICVCAGNNLIFIADEKSRRINVYTNEAQLVTCITQTRYEQIIDLFALRDALFVLDKQTISVFHDLSCFVKTISTDSTALDVSDQFVYIGTLARFILVFTHIICIVSQIELSDSYLTEESFLKDFKVLDDSLIYALFTQSTFPFQIFTTAGVFISYISYSHHLLTPLSIAISSRRYVAISDGTSNSVKIYDPSFNLVHSLDNIFELRRTLFLENSLLVTNSSLDNNLYIF